MNATTDSLKADVVKPVPLSSPAQAKDEDVAMSPAEPRQAVLDRRIGECVYHYFNSGTANDPGPMPTEFRYLVRERSSLLRTPKRGKLRESKAVAIARVTTKRTIR